MNEELNSEEDIIQVGQNSDEDIIQVG
jgi:hypothetical protein